MNRKGTADLPLHYGKVPPWLATRMQRLGRAITEAIVLEFGPHEFLKRISDPFWFQSLGAVMGMDWHSSGITTSVVGALKKAINPISKDLGLYVCGGRGRFSKGTPRELWQFADRTGLNGDELVRSSKLSAKVDNTAIQDGYQIYLHSFFVSYEGKWSVVQQGLNNDNGYARRYHWHVDQFESFVKDPHAFIYGQNQGKILNLTTAPAQPAQSAIMDLARQKPIHVIQEVKGLRMPSHHEVKAKDLDLKRLGSVIALSQEKAVEGFEELLLIPGLGPRTLQSLALVSEVIYGKPTRFEDPARYSFAHGGKDGHPFPVPTKVYDKTIQTLKVAVNKAKIGHSEKLEAMRKLHDQALHIEKNFQPNDRYAALIEHEWKQSKQFGGRTVAMDEPKKPRRKEIAKQLRLF